jgi:hypothetical protein
MAEGSGASYAVVGAIGIVLGAIITGNYSYLGHESDLDAKMIEMSIGILRSEPKPETEPLREWAIDAIGKRGRFSFNAEQRAVLLKKQLPSPQFASVQGACAAFTRPEYAIKGRTRDDQYWIDVMIETGIAGCGWKRPLARPASLDATPTNEPAKSQGK